MAHARVAEERERIDTFHRDFNATVAAGNSLAGQDGDVCYCGGCMTDIDRPEALMCGGCHCMAFCNKECQRHGWRARGHRAACNLLARARALPPADPARVYVVQLKLAGRQGLRDWADDLERTGQPELAAIHREMAAGLAPRDRVLFALEARHHVLLRFQIVPAAQRLESNSIALFALRAVLEPSADVPTLNMPRDQPQRPYAIWVPTSLSTERPMSSAVGRELAGCGLPTSVWYVGGGFCAEARLRARGGDAGADGEVLADPLLINTFADLDPDFYTEDEMEDEDEDEDDEDRPPTLPRADAAPAAANGATPAAPGVPTRVLVISGLHMFGLVGEPDDPLLAATAGALRIAGMSVELTMYDKRGGRAAQQVLAERLTAGDYRACVVLGLGSGDDFRPRNPSFPWGDGPWKDALTAWVRAGGVLVLHGERAVAGVARSFFGLTWTMDGGFYMRTDHRLNRGCPLLGSLARRLPVEYNAKACMLSDVPPAEQVYATEAGAQTHSLVPFMAGAPVEPGRCAMAAARVGSGAVAFFGDVNWEEPTMRAVTALVGELTGERGVAAA